MVIARVDLTVRALDASYVETTTTLVTIDPDKDTTYLLGVGSQDNVRWTRIIDKHGITDLRRELLADELAQRLAQAVRNGDVEAALVLADIILERYAQDESA